jgi:hypothetical protein
MKALIISLILLLTNISYSQIYETKSLEETICSDRSVSIHKGGYKSVEYLITYISDVKDINFYNSLGEVVHKPEINSFVEFNTNSPGLYFIQVEYKNGCVDSHKFIQL